MTRFFLKGLTAMALVALVSAAAPTAEAAHIDVTFISQTNQALIARGDFHRVRFEVCNNGASGMAQLGAVFVKYTAPNGGIIKHVIENKIIQPFTCREYRYKDAIQMSAVGGTYTVEVGFSWNAGANGVSQSKNFTLPPMGALTAQVAPATASSLTAAPTQAGPNPFSASTTIRYELAQEAEVSLAVYDVMGREVASLVNGTQAAGAQSAVFSGDNLPAGSYIYRLSVDGAVQSGRVNLVR